MSKCKECNINPPRPDNSYCSDCLSATKTCRRCGISKNIFDFERNQKTIKGRIARRGECKECRVRKKPLKANIRKEYEKNNPKQSIGEEFCCPICKVKFLRQYTNDVVLDHDHSTGEARGYICRNCNSGMGQMEDSPQILMRATKWLQKKNPSFLF